jgi:hypothetical protein
MTMLILRSLLFLALSAIQWEALAATQEPDLSPSHQALIVRRVTAAAGGGCYSSIPVTNYIEVTEQGGYFVDFKIFQTFSDQTKCNKMPPIFNHVDHMFVDVGGRCMFDSQVGCGEWQHLKYVPCVWGATTMIKLWVNDYHVLSTTDQFPTCSDLDGDSPDESCLPDRWCQIDIELVCNPSLQFLI